MDDNTKLRDAVHRAVAAVILQGTRSVDCAGNCRYRGPNGLKCVVGHMIADDVYDESLEDQLATAPDVIYALCSSLSSAPPTLEQREYLHYLQAWHDDLGDGFGSTSSIRQTTESFADWKLRTLPDFIDRALVERLVQEGRANG